MGAAGGALGVTVAYLNIGDQGTAEPVNAHTIDRTSPRSAPTTAAPGADLRFSVRGAGGYAWFNENRDVRHHRRLGDQHRASGTATSPTATPARLRGPPRPLLPAAGSELRLPLPQRERPRPDRRRPWLRPDDRPAHQRARDRRRGSSPSAPSTATTPGSGRRSSAATGRCCSATSPTRWRTSPAPAAAVHAVARRRQRRLGGGRASR